MVSGGAYVPKRGDLIWITLNPQAGHEQSGRRPALVISPGAYNAKVELALLCPVTSQAKGYPFEVGIPPGAGVEGVVLSDHVKCLDWRACDAKHIGALPGSALREVLAKLATLVG